MVNFVKPVRRLVLLGSLLLAACLPGPGEDIHQPEVAFASQWVWRNPLPHGYSLGAIASGGNVRLVFGAMGVMRSVNEGAWEIHALERDLSAAAWTGNQFVGVGNNVTATSPDGKAWTFRYMPSDTTHNFADVIWTGKLLVAVGWGYPEAAIFTSPDGITWTERSSLGAVSLSGVIWTGTQVVAVGAGGGILTSPDGLIWTKRSSGIGHWLYDVVWTGTQLVAAGTSSLLTSPDGITWTNRGEALSFRGLAWTGSKLVGTNGYMIRTSSDGVNWALSATLPEGINDLAWTDSGLLAVGNDGAMFGSSDGLTWTSHASGSRAFLTDVAWNGTQFVAVGEEGVVLTSPDGITWTERAAGSVDLNAVAWTGSQWVAVGQGGGILTSPDAVSWTTRTSGVTAALRDVEWAEGVLVTLGDKGAVLTSSDGIVWTSRSSGTAEYLNCLLWDGSRWLAGGSNGTLLESADGTEWTSRQIDTPLDFGDGFTIGAWLSSIIRTESEYIITVPGFHPGRGAYLLTSPDGSTWTRRNGANLARGFRLNNHLVGIADGSDTPTEATIMISKNGNVWTSNRLGTANSITAIAWGNGRLVAVGYRGTIFSSP